MSKRPRELQLIAKGGVVRVVDPLSLKTIYTLTAPRLSFTSTLHRGDSEDDATVVGGLKINGALGNARYTVDEKIGDETAWIDMKNESRIMKLNHFSFSTNTPEGQRKLDWKGTREVPHKIEKLDVLNLKLVDDKTDQLVARFVHKLNGSRAMDGMLEFHEDIGEEWDRRILLSCLAVLKYNSFMWSLNIF
ncbi:hypothetical protein NA57DRAFT_78079 [Rhizodiscina lignyota]|uniref:Uncharacterized protein n=1 Tax=Rhizodiscina lignyota TaxID=1504668 RepID=A0A9P4M472_9PEZI|nr:hypothetical protein NA57DRAFT_78079 [Rhizodiscina lignyota]